MEDSTASLAVSLDSARIGVCKLSSVSLNVNAADVSLNELMCTHPACDARARYARVQVLLINVLECHLQLTFKLIQSFSTLSERKTLLCNREI